MAKNEPKNRKINVRDAFKEYAEVEFARKFGELTNKQLTKGLTNFFVDEIHNPLRSLIGDDDFERGYVDAGKDLGVDFIHRDDHAVLILQVKYLSSANGPSPDEVSHFLGVLQRLRDFSALKANKALAEIAADIEWEVDQFECKFICLGRIENQVEHLAKAQPNLPDIKGLVDRINFDFLSEPRLTEELRAARSFNKVGTEESVIFAHEENGVRGPIIELEADGRNAVVLVVRASQLVTLYKRFREGLFELNIRNYVGDSKTNKAMIKAAREQAGRFFHMNNGLACVATTLEVDAKLGCVKVTGLQVINGAQTVKSIRKASDHGWEAGEPLLLIRIVEVSQGYGEAGRFRTDVVKANNTQNKVKDSDFRSNDPIQADLVRQFGGYKRFGRSVVYVPKRTDALSARNNDLIRLEEFAKTIYSFLANPVSFSGATSFLFDDSASGGYKEVFGDGSDIWDIMPGDEFRLRSALWWIGQEFSDRFSALRAEEVGVDKRAARERKWMLFYTTAGVLKSIYPDNYRTAVGKHYEGNWRLGEDKTGRWFEDVFKRADAALLMAYEQSKEADPNFIHRNWMRGKATAARIDRAIERLNAYGGPLAPLS